MRHLIFVAAMLGCLSTAWAQGVLIKDVQLKSTATSLASVALTAAEGLRTTATIEVAGVTEVVAYIEYERGGTGAATAITLTCYAGRAYTKLGPIGILYESGTVGTRNVVPHVWSSAVTATSTVRIVVEPINDIYMRCVVGSTGVVTGDDVVARVDFRRGKG